MRPAPDYRYSETYDETYYTRSLQGFVFARGHAALERRHGPSETFARVVEVGAGTGQHIRHVRHQFDEYVVTDNNPAVLEVAKRNAPAGVADRLRYETQEAGRLTYPDASFDRLIACHVLEHMHEPLDALREWSRVVRPGGLLSFVLPCDPGLAWRLGRMLGPRRAWKARGMPYDYVLATEHVNSIFNLRQYLRYHFKVEDELWFPLRVPLPDLNLLYVCEVRNTPPEG